MLEGMPERLLPFFLIVQGVLGGIDTLYNHEWRERLPSRPEVRTEVALHAAREAIYATLFTAIAWGTWHGLWAIAIGALLLLQIAVDVSDEFIENRSRVLPQFERVLHFLIVLNLGLITALLTPVLVAWAAQETAVAFRPLGIVSWLLCGLALCAGGWSVRDALAWRALGRAQRKLKPAWPSSDKKSPGTR